MIKLRKSFYLSLMILVALIIIPGIIFAQSEQDLTTHQTGEALYHRLIDIVQNDEALFQKIQNKFGEVSYEGEDLYQFEGNLRFIHPEEDIDGSTGLYLLRVEDTGSVFILDIPKDLSEMEGDSDSAYAGVEEMLTNKMVYTVNTSSVAINGESFTFAKIMEKPYQKLFNVIFHIAIVAFLFSIMVGMGMTLTINDFKLIFKDPRGIILGTIIQFGLVPLLAFLLCTIAGFEAFPFVFAGIMLIACSPGGVTSNLFTYYGKGDLALSISLTAIATMMCVFFTPFLLTAYSSNLPEVSIPTLDIFLQILVLVLIPLSLGMFIRYKAENFAKQAEKFFSLLGIIALLFIMITGVIDNLEKFTHTEIYNVQFYLILFSLAVMGMLTSVLFAKVLKINNFQTRAISIEAGIKNATLAMAIALLIQDRMGDFYSSMFTASGIYGLMMFPVGFLMLLSFKKILPLKDKAAEVPEGAIPEND